MTRFLYNHLNFKSIYFFFPDGFKLNTLSYRVDKIK